MKIIIKKYAFLLLLGAFLALVIALSAGIKANAQSYNSYYESVLNQYVNSNGKVNYKALKNNRQNLDKYVSAIASINSKDFKNWTKNEKLAFWINTYNALTVKLIVDKYSVKSIKDIPLAWDLYKFNVMGKNLSLNDIEHKILRKEFKEPRIHFSIVCASMDCPNLRNEIYEADKLNIQLDDQAKKFVNSSKGTKIDTKNSVVYVSSIFKWFGEDFISKYNTSEKLKRFPDKERSFLNFIQNYILASTKDYINTNQTYQVKYLDYNWSLNELR